MILHSAPPPLMEPFSNKGLRYSELFSGIPEQSFSVPVTENRLNDLLENIVIYLSRLEINSHDFIRQLIHSINETEFNDGCENKLKAIVYTHFDKCTRIVAESKESILGSLQEADEAYNTFSFYDEPLYAEGMKADVLNEWKIQSIEEPWYK